ncbi:SDR family NAD(P)-dependent oxidoreductase [Mucilaginibacter sp.]|uniref:SDR family NAD(P)-dependent oxidoreductase n=1 Tax=Mucilaginibacter sp. TaxID=1882438 RepID=UPI003D148081
MKSIFITGSADGLGLLAAKELVKQGHWVTLHARNEIRSKEAMQLVPGAAGVLAADLSDMQATKRLAAEVNNLGAFDTIIHNAGVYKASAQQILNVNTIAPYILSCLVPARRLIYLSSSSHLSGDATLKGLKSVPPMVTYSDSKLHDLILAKAMAGKLSNVYANAIDPGWVPTKMGGADAPDDLDKGFQTQVWLAASDDPKALVTGKYFNHQRQAKYRTESDDVEIQEQFLSICEKICGVAFQKS